MWAEPSGPPHGPSNTTDSSASRSREERGRGGLQKVKEEKA